MYACFDQPDLKAHLHAHGDRAAGLGGHLQRRRRRGPEDAGGAQVSGSDHAADLDRTSPRWSPGRTTRCTTATTASTWASTAGPRWPSTSTPTSIFAGHQAGLRLVSTETFDYRYPFDKYDQLFVPEFNAGAMENAGAVTFREDYVFRSKVTDARVRAARRDDPARDGAHVVRRPGHHALVGRPVAERVVRHLRLGALPGAGDPVARLPGRRSPTSRRPGPTGRTSCRRRTRSPPTSPTCRRSRSTSTASRTPRAPACSSSSWPTSAIDAVPAGDAGRTSSARVRQHHARRPARRAGARSPAAT